MDMVVCVGAFLRVLVGRRGSGQLMSACVHRRVSATESVLTSSKAGQNGDSFGESSERTDM